MSEPRRAAANGSNGRFRLRVTENNRPSNERWAVLLLQNVASFARQLRFDTNDAGELVAEAPVGEYSVQVAARSGSLGRGLLEVTAERVAEVTIAADKGPEKKPTFAERLQVYGIDPQKTPPQSLRLRAGDRVALDAEKARDPRMFTINHARSISDLKRWIGSPDDAHVHDMPIFGPLPKLDPGGLEGRPQRANADALRHIAREYIFGNISAVAQFEGALNRFVAGSEIAHIPIFYFNDVLIDAGATLEIGRNSNVFTCDTLRIHRTGTLSVVGDVRADIGAYEVFG
jgi:hypothetical protein